MQPILSLPCCTKKSPPLLLTHSPISTRAIRAGSLAAPARRNHLLVTDCCVFNEPQENKEREGCEARRVCCSGCQIHPNSDNSQMFGCSFLREIRGRCRAQKFTGTHTEVAVWVKVSWPWRAPSLLPLCLPLAAVDGNGGTNSREKCLWVARRINKGSRFVFQEPRSSLKAISQLRNEPPEPAQEPKCFGPNANSVG